MAKRRKKKDAEIPVEKFGDRMISVHRRARFNYELSDSFEAGLVLLGSEVKMLRQGSADLTDTWCRIERGEAILHGLNIPEMSGTHWGHEAKRPRKLLLHKHQIEQLKKGMERQGMTVVATRLYFRGGHVKIEIALAKGKRLIDKRQTVKEREADREARAAIDRGMR